MSPWTAWVIGYWCAALPLTAVVFWQAWIYEHDRRQR